MSEAWDFENDGVGSAVSDAVAKLWQLFSDGISDASGNKVIAQDNILEMRVTRSANAIDVAFSAPAVWSAWTSTTSRSRTAWPRCPSPAFRSSPKSI